MTGDSRALAIIAARGGSKGLPRKNILDLGGKPLIAWSILAAHGAAGVERTILSSDDPEIIETARAWGCDVPFVRPAALADDETGAEDVVLHALDALGESFDTVIFLQPTSPFRTSADIDGALAMKAATDAPAVVSVCETAKSPFWMYFVDDDSGVMRSVIPGRHSKRRQDLPTTYALNGAVYVADVDWFRKERSFLSARTVAYVMPRARSVDIDTEDDLVFAASLVHRGTMAPPESPPVAAQPSEKG